MRPFLLLPLLVLVALPACRGVGSPDVAAQFDRDLRQVQLRLPAKADLDPARLEAGDMAETIRLARQYLEVDPGMSMPARYVRALLACALLMQGDAEAAHDTMAGIQPLREDRLAHENQVINATLHIVSACRTVTARNALEQLLEGKMGVAEFVESYGSFVAIELPDPEAASYREVVGIHTAQLRELCFAAVAGDPRQMETVHEQRTDLHRLIGEQLYNDMAALLVALPEDRSAESEWLRFAAISSYLSFGFLFHEVVPMRLGQAQKAWQLEQCDGLFQRTKAVRRRLRPSRRRPEYVTIPERLRDTQIEIRGWIETR